jgi:hypothetical protein
MRVEENLFLSLSALEIALQKSSSLLFVLLSSNPQKYFADLGHASSLPVCNLHEFLLEFSRNSESQRGIFSVRHRRYCKTNSLFCLINTLTRIQMRKYDYV